MSMTPASPPDDRTAAALGGFGPVGLLAFVGIVAVALGSTALSALLVLAWARASRTPWRALGFVRPAHWLRTVAAGAAFGVVLKLVLKSLVMPLLGAPALNPAYQFLAGNAAELPGMILVLFVNAGFGEETLYRGYLFERLGRLVGDGVAARVGIVIVTSSVFALAHLADQGLPGAEQAAITGLAFGSIFAVRRSLAVLMIAHVAFDLTAVALIYARLEAPVAHWFLR